MVTGAAALMLAAHNTFTAAQLKDRLINGSDESTALNNRSVSDGKLNVNKSVRGLSGINLSSATKTMLASSTTDGQTSRSLLFSDLPVYI